MHCSWQVTSHLCGVGNTEQLCTGSLLLKGSGAHRVLLQYIFIHVLVMRCLLTVPLCCCWLPEHTEKLLAAMRITDYCSA